MQYTETELSDLIKSVEAEFSAHLALAKSEDFPKKEDPKEEPKEDEKDKKEPKAEDEKSEAQPEEKGEEKQEEHQEEPKKEGEEEAPKAELKPEHDEDGHDYDDEDMAHLDKMYGSMKKGELKVHHDCIKKCLDMHKEGAAMAKSETIVIEVPAEKTKEIALLKSEVEAEKAKSENLQKSLDTVAELLTKMVKRTAPAAKAVTDLQVINKSEMSAPELKPLTKSEINAKLTQVASRPDLEKSDRQAINDYYLGNNPNIEKISHLLK